MRALRLAVLMALVIACVGSHPPSNVTVQVANEMAKTAKFVWQSPGLLGTGLFRSTESEAVGGCAIYTRGFGPGPNTVEISLDAELLTLTFDASPTDQQQRFVLIDTAGKIAEITADTVPTDPCG